MPDTAEPITLLPQPEPGLTPAMLVERAAALRPLLLSQQAESDWRGCYSAEVHAAFGKAGFYRILQPKMFGGYEMEPKDFLKVVMQIARGHPGAGWCFTLAASHGFFIASHFPEAVQRELFGPDGEFRSPQVIGPFGTMTATDGGVIVDGVFPFASGIPVCTHFMGASLLHVPGGAPRHLFFCVPVSEVEILPDWGEDRFMGMQASGSNSVKLDKVFVPERMLHPVDMLMSSDTFPKGSPGVRLHRNPMYLGVMVGWFSCEFGAILTGTARAAIDEFMARARTRPVFGNPALKQMDDPFTQNLLGNVLGMVDAAEALTLRGAEIYLEQARRAVAEDRPLTALETYEVWGLSREACKLACSAVEQLFHASGASGGRRDQRLGRYFRDIEMYRLHIQSQPNLPSVRGQLAFGLAGGLFAPGG